MAKVAEFQPDMVKIGFSKPLLQIYRKGGRRQDTLVFQLANILIFKAYSRALGTKT